MRDPFPERVYGIFSAERIHNMSPTEHAKQYQHAKRMALKWGWNLQVSWPEPRKVFPC